MHASSLPNRICICNRPGMRHHVWRGVAVKQLLTWIASVMQRHLCGSGRQPTQRAADDRVRCQQSALSAHKGVSQRWTFGASSEHPIDPVHGHRRSSTGASVLAHQPSCVSLLPQTRSVAGTVFLEVCVENLSPTAPIFLDYVRLEASGGGTVEHLGVPKTLDGPSAAADAPEFLQRHIDGLQIVQPSGAHNLLYRLGAPPPPGGRGGNGKAELGRLEIKWRRSMGEVRSPAARTASLVSVVQLALIQLGSAYMGHEATCEGPAPKQPAAILLVLTDESALVNTRRPQTQHIMLSRRRGDEFATITLTTSLRSCPGGPAADTAHHAERGTAPGGTAPHRRAASGAAGAAL